MVIIEACRVQEGKIVMCAPAGPCTTVIASQTWVVTDSAPVRVQPADLHKFDGEGLKVINLERGGDGKPGILHHPGGKIPVYRCLR